MSDQPGPGGIAAPDYGRPPRKSRAGLFIVLMLVLLVAVLVAFALIATRVFTDLRSADPPPPDPVASAPPPSKSTASAKPKPTASAKPRPSVTAKPVPVKPLPVTPTPANSAQVAARFVARLNANDAKGAAALGCTDTARSIPVVMERFVRQPAALTASGAPVSTAGSIAVFSVSGTMKGATAGGIVVVEAASRSCVKSFVLH